MNETPIASIILGCLCVAGYLIGCGCKRRKGTLADVVTLFIAGAGAVVGGKLCWFAITSNVLSGDEQIYLFLGGLCVIWSSGQTVSTNVRKAWRTIKRRPRKATAAPAE